MSMVLCIQKENAKFSTTTFGHLLRNKQTREKISQNDTHTNRTFSVPVQWTIFVRSSLFHYTLYVMCGLVSDWNEWCKIGHCQRDFQAHLKHNLCARMHFSWPISSIRLFSVRFRFRFSVQFRPSVHWIPQTNKEADHSVLQHTACAEYAVHISKAQ